VLDPAVRHPDPAAVVHVEAHAPRSVSACGGQCYGHYGFLR
jgi:hypothetical protein